MHTETAQETSASVDQMEKARAILIAIHNRQAQRRTVTECTAILCRLIEVLCVLACRWSILAGCAYLVFLRGESGWLFVPALCLALISRRIFHR